MMRALWRCLFVTDMSASSWKYNGPRKQGYCILSDAKSDGFNTLRGEGRGIEFRPDGSRYTGTYTSAYCIMLCDLHCDLYMFECLYIGWFLFYRKRNGIMIVVRCVRVSNIWNNCWKWAGQHWNLVVRRTYLRPWNQCWREHKTSLIPHTLPMNTGRIFFF